MNKLLSILSFALLLAVGCNVTHRFSEYTSLVIPDQTNITRENLSKQSIINSAPAPSLPTQNNTDVDFLTKLISHIWQTSNGSGAVYSYEFSPDGSVTRNVMSDYTHTDKGRWAYKQVSLQEGLLFLLWPSTISSGESESKEREEVLYFRISATNKVNVIGGSLTAGKLLKTNHTLESIKKLSGIISEKNFPNYFRITAHSWKKTSLKNNDSVPDTYQFHSDGTFVAQYRKGECQHGGHWSLESGQISLELPAQHCDLRGYNKAVVWGQVYEFYNSSLVLNKAYVYTPGN